MLPLILAALLGWDALPGASAQQQPFEAVALSWPHGDARVRVSTDGITWSEWIDVPVDHDLSGDGRLYSGIVHLGREFRFVETNAERATLFPMPSRGPRLRATPNEFAFGNVTVRSRSDWGCPEGQGSPRWTPVYTHVTHLIVHHTAGANSVPDWEAEMRNIWFFHTFTRGWEDIGYNFLIDPNGVVYEGRAGGTNTIGAHFSCRNTNTVGIALLGTYSTVAPTNAALQSLKHVLAELSRRHALDPASTALHAPSNLLLPRISGHRDGNGSPLTCTRTECPGDVVYAMLPELRTSVAVPPAPPRRRAATK
jgi:N-acetylmuramoyl-L-alanine amidase